MIDEIHVADLALIRDATIFPARGMTVVTGETGAGKTALLESCKLLMGQRASASLIREGEDSCEVEGRFFEGDGAETVVSRRVSADGRSRVRIDGRMASVTELADAIAPAIGLCSQHDQRMLSKPQVQRAYLDAFAFDGEDDGVLAAYSHAYADAVEAARKLEELRIAATASDSRVEDAKYRLRQIEAVGPSQEDYDELMAALSRAENAEVLARTSSLASDLLSGEGGALDSLNAAVAFLSEGARADAKLDDYANAIREAVYIIEDAARDVSGYAQAIDLDASSLALMQERAAAYQSLLRSFGPTIQDVLDEEARCRAVIDAIANSGEAMAKAKAAADAAEGALAKAADALFGAREGASGRFADAVSDVMSRLDMGTASLECSVRMLPRESWNADGPCSVEFLFTPAQGMTPRPLSRIASGGELSRVMLAIHAVMGARDDVSTLVFDEIDAGVGGHAALALADVLASLAQTHQLLVVTHLAQVAAKADCHYVAAKVGEGADTFTAIDEVSGENRLHELARMLSGTITDASLAHAAELLESE